MNSLTIPKFLTSITAVVVPMLVLLFAFIINTSVLYHRALPEDMSELLRLAASGLLGFALAFPLILTAVNSQLLSGFKIWKIGFPETFGVFTAFMTALFFDVFNNPGAPWHWFVLVGFISVLHGLIDYLYAYLFIKKYQEETTEQKAAEMIKQLIPENEQLKKQNAEIEKLLSEANKLLSEYQKQLTCKHCGTLIPEGFSALRNHIQRKCPVKNQLKHDNTLTPIQS